MIFTSLLLNLKQSDKKFNMFCHGHCKMKSMAAVHVFSK